MVHRLNFDSASSKDVRLTHLAHDTAHSNDGAFGRSAGHQGLRHSLGEEEATLEGGRQGRQRRGAVEGKRGRERIQTGDGGKEEVG